MLQLVGPDTLLPESVIPPDYEDDDDEDVKGICKRVYVRCFHAVSKHFEVAAIGHDPDFFYIYVDDGNCYDLHVRSYQEQYVEVLADHSYLEELYERGFMEDLFKIAEGSLFKLRIISWPD